MGIYLYSRLLSSSPIIALVVGVTPLRGSVTKYSEILRAKLERMAIRGYTVERRVKLFCVTCSFAPDDLFFPVIITAAIKGTW